MRRIWSECEKRRTWRRIWVALAGAQAELGLVTAEQVADVAAHASEVDVAAAEELEKELKHDLVAELRVYAAQCPVGGGILHLGATSMDIEDNADALRLKASLALVRRALHALLARLGVLVAAHADHATMGFTHLQPAEPTTLGYRFAQWAQDLQEDARLLARVHADVRGKGLKGATGTSAGYVELLGGDPTAAARLEGLVLGQLQLDAYDVATQTYPRKQDYTVLAAVAGLGQSLYKLAFDLRLLQSPVLGELSEPFGTHQVGSSAMPFKRNPVSAENIDSLARHLATLPRVAWDNAAHSLLERTLDDSANRRSVLPEAFLIADTIVARTAGILNGLVIDRGASERLLASYGVFAATERVMMEAVKGGGDRQVLHEVLREQALAAWPMVQAGHANPLPERLAADPRITAFLDPRRIPELLDARGHVGDAPIRARAFAAKMTTEVARLEQEVPC
jgi:adenylosuccinate lyase